MKQVRQKSRLLRVRKLQHDLAAIAAVNAAERVRMLEEQHGKLRTVGRDLALGPGDTAGMTIAGRAELAMRLRAAEAGLAHAIANAKVNASSRDAARSDARRLQEAADKLRSKAIAEKAARELRRNASLPRGRRADLEDLDA